MIFESLFEGVKLGLLLSLMVGPVFFALIRSSMDSGFKQAAFLAFGVLLSDLVYVLGTYFGVHLLSQFPWVEKSLGYLGGLILIGFGISFMKKKPVEEVEGSSSGASSPLNSLLQGFGINGVNPFVFLFWISIASIISVKESWGGPQISLFYAALLLTVFSIDLSKAFLASKLAHLVTPKVRKGLHIGVGILICYLGLKMLWTTFSTLG